MPLAGIRLEMQLQGARFASDVTNSVKKARLVVEEDMRVTRNIERTVIGGEKHAFSGPKAGRQRCGRGIHRLECGQPLPGLPAVIVCSMVDLRRVDVDERVVVGIKNPPGFVDALADRGPAAIVGAAQHGGREAGVAEALDADREGRNAVIRRPLENRPRPLPGEGVEFVVPAGEQLHDAVVLRIECRVADHSMHSRKRSGRDRGESTRGRRGESGCRHRRLRHRRLRQRAGQRARVPRALGDGIHSETVDDEHHGPLDRRQRQRIRPRQEGIEATWQNVGKARPL